MELSIQVEESFAPVVDEELLKRVVRVSLATLGAGEGVELGVLITDDETVRGLNRQYRGLDETTDVLAFALRDAPRETFPMPLEEPPSLGDIVISYPQAQRQAQEEGHSVDRELSQLLVHGLLHLLGYDHGEAEEAEQMHTLERTIGQQLFP